MPKDQKKNSIKTHKANLRKLIKDERLQPRVRFMAELFLAHLEGMFPEHLIESILEAEFGVKAKKVDNEPTIEEAIDKNASSGLKMQWENLIGGDHGSN